MILRKDYIENLIYLGDIESSDERLNKMDGFLKLAQQEGTIKINKETNYKTIVDAYHKIYNEGSLSTIKKHYNFIDYDENDEPIYGDILVETEKINHYIVVTIGENILTKNEKQKLQKLKHLKINEVKQLNNLNQSFVTYTTNQVVMRDITTGSFGVDFVFLDLVCLCTLNNEVTENKKC